MSFVDDRLSQWMLGEFLGDRRPDKNICLSLLAETPDVGHLRVAIGEGPGLIDHHRIHSTGCLQAPPSFDQDAASGSVADGGDHCRRGGQHEGTRTGHNQYGDCLDYVISSEVNGKSNHQNDRGKVFGEPIGDPLRRGFVRLRLLYQLNYVRQRGLPANLSRGDL